MGPVPGEGRAGSFRLARDEGTTTIEHRSWCSLALVLALPGVPGQGGDAGQEVADAKKGDLRQKGRRHGPGVQHALAAASVNTSGCDPVGRNGARGAYCCDDRSRSGRRPGTKDACCTRSREVAISMQNNRRMAAKLRRRISRKHGVPTGRARRRRQGGGHQRSDPLPSAQS